MKELIEKIYGEIEAFKLNADAQVNKENEKKLVKRSTFFHFSCNVSPKTCIYISGLGFSTRFKVG